MSFLLNLLFIVQILSALAMVGLILMQHGKGADMGAAFGSGASGSLFGASGSANFLSRSTAVLATVFFITTLILAYYGNAPRMVDNGNSVLGRMSAAVPAEAASAAAAPAVTSSDPVAMVPGNAAPQAPALAPAAVAAPSTAEPASQPASAASQ